MSSTMVVDPIAAMSKSEGQVGIEVGSMGCSGKVEVEEGMVNSFFSVELAVVDVVGEA